MSDGMTMATPRIRRQSHLHPRNLRLTAIQLLPLLLIVFTAGRFFGEHQIRSRIDQQHDDDNVVDTNRRLPPPPKKQPNPKRLEGSHSKVQQQQQKRLTKQQTPLKQKPPRFLMGIFSPLKDYTQRNLVRESLALYNDTRVCSFGSTIDGKPPPRIPADRCQLLYTFVIGANSTGPKQIVKSAETPRDPQFVLSKPPSNWNAKHEPQNDITFLNIQENVHRGKTPTWFHYASLVMVKYRIQYAIKSRGDTFLLVDQFLNQVVPTHFSKAVTLPRLVYAGDARWSYNNRHIYMTGAWFLLSRELAGWMSNKELTTVKGIRWKEDADAGYCLMVRHAMVHLIDFGADRPWRQVPAHKNQTKDSTEHPNAFREKLYRQWIQQESQRLYGSAPPKARQR